MKKNKKLSIKQIIILGVLGLFCGFALGYIFNKLNIGGLIEVTGLFLNRNIIGLITGFSSLCALSSLYFYIKAKKEVDRGLMEDGYIETKYIDYANAMRDAGFYTLLSFLIILYNRTKRSPDFIKDTLLIFFILFTFVVIFVILTYLIYQLVKRIEPDRKTGVFDIYFDTKFMAESDERDKVKYYKKGYLAYKRMLICQLVLIIILFSSALYEEISPIIALIVLIPTLIGILTNGFAGEKND